LTQAGCKIVVVGHGAAGLSAALRATLPYALGRLARNHAISQGKYADPRKGFEAMYFDSCVFDADAPEFLAKTSTPERLMLGSDMPFPIGDPAPKKVVQAAAFSDAQRERILCSTAQTVFRVRPDCWCPR
jgi:aminocarboxymuconate-semialdehyde decarboxylase